MAQKQLCIDIREDVVSAIVLSAGTSGVRVEECGLACVGEAGLGAAIAEVIRHVDTEKAVCRLSFEAECFFYRNLLLPFSDKKKVEKVLPIELDDNIARDMTEVMVDSLVTGKKGGDSAVIAALVDKELVAERLEVLSGLGLEPEIIAVSGVQLALQLARRNPEKDFVLLDCGCRRATMFAMLDGRMRLVRSVIFDDGSHAEFTMNANTHFVSARKPELTSRTFRSLAREIRRVLYALDDVDSQISFYMTGPLAEVPGSVKELSDALGNPVEPCDLLIANNQIGCGAWRSEIMQSALALGLRRGKRQAGFNFRKGEFAQKISFRRYRKIALRLLIPITICVIALVAYSWNTFSDKKQEVAKLKKEGDAIFLETVPGVTRIVNPVQQLKVEIRELKKGMLGGVSTQSDLLVLDILAEISAQIPASINVRLIRMVADANGVNLRGLTDTFNSVDSLKKVLEKSSYFSSVTINSANLATRDTGIRFELKLQFKEG